MSSSLPDGYEVRPATADDAVALTDLLRAADVDLRGWSNVSRDDVREWMHYVERGGSAWVVERDSEAIAAAMLFALHEPPDLWGVVHPRHRGRGLGAAIVREGEAVAAERGSIALRVGTSAEDGAAAALLTSRGYRDVRHYYTMVIELSERPPAATPPAGVRIEAFRVEDARAFHAAQTEAFEEEWGFVPLPFDEWKRLRLDPDDADTTLWFVARDGGEIAGVIRCDPNRRGGGFVGAVGVRKPWRRRGLGEALLSHAFGAFYERGERSVRLGVDAQNPTGATRLYERVGMHVETEDVVYERTLV